MSDAENETDVQVGKRKRAPKSVSFEPTQSAATKTTKNARPRIKTGPPTPKTSTPKTPKTPKISTPKPSVSTTVWRTWMCTDHSVLFGGRPGMVVVATSEEEALKLAKDALIRRGVKVERPIKLSLMEPGSVFLFQ